jgi:hypothetical protein
MATILLLYHSNDRNYADALERALSDKGHDVRRRAADTFSGDEWRRALQDELPSSDAGILLITESFLRLNHLTAETGAVEALSLERGLFVVPVIVGGLPTPKFLQHLDDLTVRVGSPREFSDKHSAIVHAFEAYFSTLGGHYPRVFISHRHKDEDVATALVRLLEAAFYIERADIRCTSVHPYRLPPGERTAERVRNEIRRARVVLGILTPDTKDSSYVLLELGASWGQEVASWPLLAKGATVTDVPSPISDVQVLRLEDERECHQLIDDLPELTGLKRRVGVGAHVAERIKELAKAARGGQGARSIKPDPATEPAERQVTAAKSMQLKQLLSDSRYSGRSLAKLCKETKLSEVECRKLLLELNAREIQMKKGEGWTLRPRPERRGAGR